LTVFGSGTLLNVLRLIVRVTPQKVTGFSA
jgi:hypothetical protein